MVGENGDGDGMRRPGALGAAREAILPLAVQAKPGRSRDPAPYNSVQRETRSKKPREGFREGFCPLESPD